MISQLFIRGLQQKRGTSPTDSYVFSLAAVKHIESFQFRKNVTFLVGENGTGKSTLLEAIAVNYGFNAEGGSINFNFSTAETHSPLSEHITVIKGARRPQDGFFLRAESFYNLATEIDRLDVCQSYGGGSLHCKSHGESFLALVLNRFRGNGLYLLDEPEAALSPVRLLTLLSCICELAAQGSQFIIATHSPMLIALPDSELYLLSEKAPCLTPYGDTEHFIVTKKFLQNPDRMIKQLFDKKSPSDYSNGQ